MRGVPVPWAEFLAHNPTPFGTESGPNANPRGATLPSGCRFFWRIHRRCLATLPDAPWSGSPAHVPAVLLLSRFHSPLSRSALHSSSSRRRSAMICYESSNACYYVSGSYADLVGTDLPGGSYRDQHGPPINCRSGRSAERRRMTAVGWPRRFPSSGERPGNGATLSPERIPANVPGAGPRRRYNRQILTIGNRRDRLCPGLARGGS
jgi:hypothetical protein